MMAKILLKCKVHTASMKTSLQVESLKTDHQRQDKQIQTKWDYVCMSFQSMQI